jgi:predicted MFS family arabinose efflux permease
MGTLVYGFIRAASVGWGDEITVGAIAVGVIALAAFAVIEARTAQPLMPLRLFANRDRAAAYLNYFFGPMAMLSMFFFLTQFLQEIRGESPLATGFAFLPMAVALFTMTRLIPLLLPRFGPKPLAVTGAALLACGLVWLTQLGADSGYAAGLLGPLLLMGIGGGLGFAPMNIIVMSSVAPQDAGVAGGAMQTMQNLGGTFGLALLVTVFGTASRHATATGASSRAAMLHGMTEAWSVGVAFAAASFLVALTFRRRAVATT